jgi:hypothetical protein
MTSLIVGIAAGAASALMFASLISGALIAIPLFYLAPLPLLVAALGWGVLRAATGGLVAGLALGLLFGFSYLAVFILTVALPACWLGYLAMLRRPAAADGSYPEEWYSPGRLLLWTAIFAALTAIAALLTLGSDSAEINAALRRGLGRVVDVRGGMASGEKSGLIDALVAAAPAAAAVVTMTTLSLNLFLAGRITATSARLIRPWPNLNDTALPPMTLVALPVALAFCFGDGLLSIAAQIVAAALLVAYAIQGIATLHAVTRGRAHRTLWLMMTYSIVLVFGWPVIALMALGLADAFFGLRQRVRPPAST